MLKKTIALTLAAALALSGTVYAARGDSGEATKKAPKDKAQYETVKERKAKPDKTSGAAIEGIKERKAKPDKTSGVAIEGVKERKSRPASGSEKATAKEKTEDTAAAVTSGYGNTVLKDGDNLKGGTYTATETDESALEASGSVKATVTGATVSKTSGSASSANDASFTGLNAGVRVYGDAEVTLKECNITATADNATAVFAYGDGVINMSDCTVVSEGGGAGGVQVAGGGTLYGTNLTVTSKSKAAIRSDKGGGTMVLDGGTYTSTGTNGCPAIYSTADITVKNAVCKSENSRAVIIEGKNSVSLANCDVTGNDQSTKTGSVKANVLLYQSASGDAAEGTSEFSMLGGKLTALSGAMFYCTNTDSVINLSGAELVLSADGSLLTVSEGRWGKTGENGGDCVLNAKDQTLTGDVLVDSISKLEMNLENSSFKGAIKGEGTVNVTLDDDSTWTLTGDSYVTSFTGELSNVNFGGFTLYVNGKAVNK